MASELYVETLKGLTSGANANKVIIPSGQTLDASAGTLTPSAGQVVQTVYNDSGNGSVTSTTSTSFVSAGDACSVSITPEFSDSDILIMFLANSDTNGINEAHRMSVFVSVNGGSYSNLSPITTSNNDNLARIHGISSRLLLNQTMIFKDTSTTTTDTRTYKIYHASTNGGSVQIRNDKAPCVMVVQEIKQ